MLVMSTLTIPCAKLKGIVKFEYLPKSATSVINAKNSSRLLIKNTGISFKIRL